MSIPIFDEFEVSSFTLDVRTISDAFPHPQQFGFLDLLRFNIPF